MADSFCTSLWKAYYYDATRQLCAGNYSGGVDTCQGERQRAPRGGQSNTVEHSRWPAPACPAWQHVQLGILRLVSRPDAWSAARDAWHPTLGSPRRLVSDARQPATLGIPRRLGGRRLRRAAFGPVGRPGRRRRAQPRPAGCRGLLRLRLRPAGPGEMPSLPAIPPGHLSRPSLPAISPGRRSRPPLPVISPGRLFRSSLPAISPGHLFRSPSGQVRWGAEHRSRAPLTGTSSGHLFRSSRPVISSGHLSRATLPAIVGPLAPGRAPQVQGSWFRF